MKRNGAIELLRFVAAISIAAYHYEWVVGGQPIYFTHFYIWVEFYFVLSGFFLSRNAICSENVDAIQYVFKQFKKLYPLYVLAFIVSFLSENFISGTSLIELIENLWKAKWEILLCYIWKFDENVAYNGGGAPAYIPVLLICSLIIYYIIQKKKETFLYIAVPIVLVGVSYIFNMQGHISVWQQRGILVPLGLIRGFVDMTFGAWCYLIIYPAIEKISFLKRLFGIMLSACALIFLVMGRNYIGLTDMFFWVLIFALLILCCSTIHLPDKLNEVFCRLGKLNYPVFLFHYPLWLWMKNYFTREDRYEIKLLYSLVLLVLICASLLLVRTRLVLRLRKEKGIY